MNRSQRFALIREAMDLLAFTDANVIVELVYADRNGDNGDGLELRRYGGHDIWDVYSTTTYATVTHSENPSQVVHDLRDLINPNYDITWIGLHGVGQNGDVHEVVLYPGGERALPRRRLPRI